MRISNWKWDFDLRKYTKEYIKVYNAKCLVWGEQVLGTVLEYLNCEVVKVCSLLWSSKMKEEIIFPHHREQAIYFEEE